MSRKAEARVVKFCVQVCYVKSYTINILQKNLRETILLKKMHKYKKSKY